LGKPYRIKPRCYWELNTWEPDGNTLRTREKTENPFPNLSPLKKKTKERKKTGPLMRVHAESFLIGCMKLLFPKQMGPKLWDIVSKLFVFQISAM
jgi:hypothetical protein